MLDEDVVSIDVPGFRARVAFQVTMTAEIMPRCAGRDISSEAQDPPSKEALMKVRNAVFYRPCKRRFG